ncbi:glucose-6-phosphate dehydrogenase [Bauldia sp.]|uniref:glucose-6-phosphate dehydrogenase n=1 Tax=Bauldia sp. TaxID=2575872 RepID=UPI003BABBBCA
MTSRIIAVEPFDLVVFGGAGDLAYRKLLPALYHRCRDGQLPGTGRIIGVSRRAMSDEAYRENTRQALVDHVPESERDGTTVDSFLDRLHFISVDATGDAGWSDLAEALKTGDDRIRAFYLAVGPELFGTICKRLGQEGLVTPETRVIIEKPIGHDLDSACAVNDAVGSVFEESQIYRIDHYLGKETVQNLMALRFGNTLLEPLWRNASVDHVQITVAETLGVEGRGGYYDNAGALRDMIQNHLLQLLCLVAMEPPAFMDADSVRDEKLKVLRSLKPIAEGNATALTVRGQYRAGAGPEGSVPAYSSEVDNPDTTTETFVAIKAEIANWRWSGVPFYLRTGKRLATRVSEIVVAFRAIPHSIFGEGAGALKPNKLVIRLQPDEGVRLWMMIKDPGPGGMRLRYVPLDMSFAEAFKVRSPDAYERLILDVIRGNQTLFMRRDEVEAAWKWIDPIADAWERGDEAPKGYTAGTWGPSASVALIERDGRTWYDEQG